MPKNSKSYALEKNSCRQGGFKKKFMHQKFYTTPHPQPPTVISNGPSHKKTWSKPENSHAISLATRIRVSE